LGYRFIHTIPGEHRTDEFAEMGFQYIQFGGADGNAGGEIGGDG